MREIVDLDQTWEGVHRKERYRVIDVTDEYVVLLSHRTMRKAKIPKERFFRLYKLVRS